MRAFYRLFIAQLKEFIRNKAALFFSFGFPIMLVVIFGLLFAGAPETDSIFNIGLIERDGEIYEQIKSDLEGRENLQVSIGEEKEELAALEARERNLVLDLENLNYQGLRSGQTQEVKMYYDATQRELNQHLINSFQQMFIQLEDSLLERERNIEVDTLSVQTEERLGDFEFIMPGILALSLMQLGLFGALDFLSLREKKIIRSLGATPVPRFALLSSELALRLTIGLVQTALLLSISYFVYDLAIVGNFGLLLAAVILGILTFASLGYMIICFVHSQEGGSALIQVVQFPMMFLSGIFFPLELLPDYIRPIVELLPLTYLADLVRQIMLGTTGQYNPVFSTLFLIGWLAATSLITVKFWSWE